MKFRGSVLDYEYLNNYRHLSTGENDISANTQASRKYCSEEN
jgi:hypothetical protein